MADSEAAICEAAARELFMAMGIKVEPNEDMAQGGPDYFCACDHGCFYGEVTCITRSAITKATERKDGFPDAAEDYFYATEKIKCKVRRKTSQCANQDAPRLLVIGTLHAQADVCFDDLAAKEVLTGAPEFAFPINAATGDLAGEVRDVTHLRESAFIRPSRMPGKGIEFASSAISAILLCGFSVRPPVVHGILHPNPIHAFDRTLLPGVKFVRLIPGCWNTGQLEIEWV